ncbi:MAG: 5-formyltetrahydrofolate cyclo-ligase [Methanomicrobiales archaeon]|nr:5-formyltetrahydrofolate cyclo-ligase [Methanomicrobiales archaeon]
MVRLMGSGISDGEEQSVWRGMSIHSDKNSLRTEVKRRRAAFSHEEMREMSCIIVERLAPLLEEFTTIMVYASKPNEIDTSGLIRRLLGEGKRVVVPIIVREDRTLRLSYLEDPSILVVSTFGVPEPIGNEIRADPRDVEVAVVPMLAYDASGNRLGYGAGYYDRFLQRYPHIMKVGVCLSCLQVSRIPSNEDDIRMDYIATESGIIDCRGKQGIPLTEAG